VTSCAIFAALSHEVVQRRVAGSLDRLNLLSEIAEGFEAAGVARLGVDPQPRRCHTSRLEGHNRASRSVAQALEHDLSRTRKLHQTLTRRGETKLERAPHARTVIHAWRCRALDFLPPADCTLAEYAEALLAADRSVHPTDDSGFRGIVHEVLARRGLVSKREERVDESRWIEYPPSWPRPSVRDAYLFLHANRHRLALAPHADQRDFVVRDVQLKRLPTSPGEVAQIAIVYEYPVDVKLALKEAEAFGEQWITLRWGGTLVFDALGVLLYEARKPVTRDEWTRRSAFWSKGPRSPSPCRCVTQTTTSGGGCATSLDRGARRRTARASVESGGVLRAIEEATHMSITLRAYNVLFGDALLVSWDEDDGTHHAWVDFGNFHNDPNAVFEKVYNDVLTRNSRQAGSAGDHAPPPRSHGGLLQPAQALQGRLHD
jgi:hypothetical protein